MNWFSAVKEHKVLMEEFGVWGAKARGLKQQRGILHKNMGRQGRIKTYHTGGGGNRAW